MRISRRSKTSSICRHEERSAAHARAGARRRGRGRAPPLALLAGGVPAGDGRRLPPQGPLSLGHRLRDHGAVPVRIRFVSDAVSGCDRVLRGDRSGGGGGMSGGGEIGGGLTGGVVVLLCLWVGLMAAR